MTGNERSFLLSDLVKDAYRSGLDFLLKTIFAGEPFA